MKTDLSPVIGSRLEKVAIDNGFDRELPAAGDWLGFASTQCPLNVATSRARCISILVGCPALFEPECKTPRQMQMANAFCRYMELAKVLPA